MALLNRHILVIALLLVVLIAPAMAISPYFCTTWTEINASAGWTTRYDFPSVVVPDGANGTIVLMGGNDGGFDREVWNSTDNGVTWQLANAAPGWGGRAGHSAVLLSDNTTIVLMGGYNGGVDYNDVWNSTDKGLTWTQVNASAEWCPRFGHSSVAMPDGSIVLMGGNIDGPGCVVGNYNDVWKSTDGGNAWTELNTSAGWTDRYRHSSVVMPDGSIILMGGYDSSYTNDTWKSTDGGDVWNNITSSSGSSWSKRFFHASIAMPDGSIVLMGGSDFFAIKNDVWRSTDKGATWTEINASAGWEPRYGFPGLAMPDGSIIILGGYDDAARYDDVWRRLAIDPPPHIQNMIYGLVIDDNTGALINGATVNIRNTTHYTTNLSFHYAGIDGVYWFENLPANENYYLNTTKIGYNPHADVIVNTGPAGSAIRQDLYLTPSYTLTLYIRDAESHGLIAPQVVDIAAIGALTSTTSTTTGVVTLPYTPVGTTYLNVSSIGYYPTSATITLTADTTATINLTQIPDWAPYPYEHYVTFRVKDYMNTGIPEVNVSAQGFMTSTGNYDWLATWLGLPTNTAPLNQSCMTGTTDDYGAITFLMIPTNKYYINFTHPSYVFTNLTLMPQDTEYIIYAEYNGTKLFYPETGYSELAAVNVTVWTWEKNASVMYLNVSYNDTLMHTTSGYVDVLQKNATPFGAPVLLIRFPVTGLADMNLWENSTEIWHLTAVSGYVDTRIIQTDFGWINRSYPFSFYSVPVSFLGFGEGLALLAALGIMIFTAMLGGASNSSQIAFVVAFEGWVFYAMHWFDALISRGYTNVELVTALILMTVFAIVMNMAVRKRKEKY